MWDNLQDIFGVALVILYWLFTALVTLRVITKRRAVSASLAWLLVIYILPVFGAMLYLMLGELSLGKQRSTRAESMVEPYLDNLKNGYSSQDIPMPGGQQSLAIHQLLAHRVGIGALAYKHLQVLDTPADIFAHLQADIAAARESIRIETYIWFCGGRVNDIAEALIAASERGVKVTILADHAGSRRFFRSRWRKRLVKAGVAVVPALPVRLWRALVNRIDVRLHRKLVVIDDRLAFTGSMNMADPDCFKRGARVGPWIDTMLRIEGQAAAGLAKVFAWDWEVETGQRSLPVLPPAGDHPDHWLSIIPSGPGIGDDLIGQSVLAGIYRANHSITIATPYFVPSEAIFDALCHAAKRGVKVRLLVPRYNDSLMVGWASRSYYEPLLLAGAEILRFEGGLLHTKAMLMDDELALVGSVNLDIRSLQLNFELTVALFNPVSCAEIGQLLERYSARCQPLSLIEWQQRGRGSRTLERLMYFMSPIL
ncbi:cardiolipin synthase [Halopseudomonas salegens]|uniref:Cardiolipin synthase n=1 Tax=Halopseudomonas salegens TaxID=1434072 RepID=A0A1H2FC50_9GAMM|nr:cardiolipin synthase [Halopseudomonas salegens]SDU04558.1 cardiolipin synthetase 2 [Halopseudomonas salegens]